MSQMPLAGVVLCFTAVVPEQRTQFSFTASQMGAQVKLDLTSDVTHLIVGDTNSAKYRYVAKAREDVKVLSPEWIHAMQKVWMAGEDVDLPSLEKQWKLPTFIGLKICLTGFDNPEQRKYIQETVTSNGAQYHGDLTKAVTHLIAASAKGSKYKHADQWGLKIVTWEWFEQSCERGMVLDEELFHPTMAVADRGQGAWDRHRRSTSPILGKRMRDVEQTEAPLNPSRRKLRRAVSDRLGSQAEALWAGITAGEVEKKPNDEDDWFENDAVHAEPLPDNGATTEAVEGPVDMQPRSNPPPRSRGPFRDDDDGIFAGRTIFLRGFDKHKTNILTEHLDSNGAVVICDVADIENFSAQDLQQGFLLVPHDVKIDCTSLPEGSGQLSLVNNWWVERCLHSKRLVNPKDCVLYRPFPKLSITRFQDLTINSTGFKGIELLHVTKAVALFGATYDEILSSNVSVLVCHNDKPNPEKLKFAAEKGIPVVHADWLWSCIESGNVQPYDGHLISTATSQPQQAKQKHHQSSAEVPTAPLSEEDKAKLQQKKKPHKSKRSDSRPISRRPGELELSASGHLTPSTIGTSNTSTDQSHHESEQHAQPPGLYDGSASLPLQDVDPGVNSPRKPSTSSTDSATHPKPDSKAAKSKPKSRADAPAKPAPAQRQTKCETEPSPDSVIPPDTQPDPPADAAAPQPPEKDYSDIMSKLLATRKTCAPAEKEDDASKAGKRKRRPLGRAPSARSLTAAAADDAASRNSSESKAVGEEDPGEDEGSVSALEALRPVQPSQQLLWDSPGAQRAREKMIRAIGGSVEEGVVLVEEEKVVKDAMGEGALGGGRASRKRRG